MNLGNLSPRQKRILLALFGAGGLALLVLVGRRAGTATAPDAGQLGATAATPGTTFADNGGQAAGLSNDVTSALGDVSVALEQLPDLVGQAVAANQPTSGPLQQPTAGLSVGDVTALVAAFSPLAQSSSSAGAPNSPVVKAAASAAKAPTAAPAAPKTLTAAPGAPGVKTTKKKNKQGQTVVTYTRAVNRP
jgi:hypothetical protein